MHLKRLEVYGFKSFATRSVLEFGEGIVAVVGPNGSGKSNIADAIRWVMGEQSYSLLRAKSTEDMIFGGTGSRARLGMAEVLITLDNSDGFLPVDYSEVVIGRRAYRSGENVYLLNGSRVRYRDVLDVLSGSGLAKSRYTVIGQGMVDAALALRPDARRALFEEAAGITAHLRKRSDALRRIEETERNLDRVRDILHELEPRARRLERQAERAEQHSFLQSDLQELQRIWYGYQWQRRQRLLAQAEEHIREQRALLALRKEEARAFGQHASDLEAKVESQNARLEEIDARLSTLGTQIESHEREQAINQERQRLYRRQRNEVEAEIRELGSRREVLEKEIERIREEIVEQDRSHRADLAGLEEARAQLEALDASRNALRAETASLEQDLSELVSQVANRRARLEELEQRRSRLVADRDEMLKKADQLGRRLVKLQGLATDAEGDLGRVEQARTDLLGEMERLQAELRAGRERLSEAESVAGRLTRAREELVSRRDLLRRLRQEMTGFYPGVRAVLNAENALQGVLGTVVSLMRVPRDLEIAIESALGGRLQNVVTETWDDAAHAIAFLKQQRRGWATFLPLDTVRAGSPLRLDAGQGIVGVACELIQFEARLRPVFELLLGRVVVVEDLNTARRLLKQRTAASLFVTLGGETVQPSGAVSGGTRRQSTDLVAQERERRDLPRLIEAATQRLGEAREQVKSCQRDLAERGSQFSALEKEASHLAVDAEEATRRVSARQSEVEKVQRERDWARSRAERNVQELEGQAREAERTTRELSDLEMRREETLERLRECRGRLEATDDEDLRQRAAKLETQAAVGAQSVQSKERLLASHIRNLEQLAKQIKEKSEQKDRLDRELSDLQMSSAAVMRRLEELRGREQDVQEEYGPARQALRSLEKRRRELEALRAQNRDRLRETESAHDHSVLERDRAVEDLATLVEEVETNLGTIDLPDDLTHQLRFSLGEQTIELPRVESLPPGLSEQIRQLRLRLRRLGSINANAPQEYEQVMERKAFLEGQQRDLREAISSLREIIGQLDAVIERDFVATFGIVDSAFRKYFARLFGGGSARLVMTEPDQVSNTGVDIIAQPPGKRAQSLSLLSGGERALTAVALLFALLSANPVPFCCLDEVDASLDEANVHRFRDLLTEHALSIQFVVITHNRNTIEAASTIYGVSMGEQGISQCVSLKLPADGESEGTAYLAAAD